jgi:hypothetical protein
VTDTDDIVLRVRVQVIESLQAFGPEATEAVLTAISAVPYRGDLDAYLQELGPVLGNAAEKACRPVLEAAAEATRIAQKRANDLQAQHEKWEREFEAFRKMKTPKRPQ